MKLDIDKIESLINKHEKSRSDFAKKIGMTHTGFRDALAKSTLKIDKLISIAEHFQKPIDYFFTETINQVEDNSSTYNHKTTSPYTKTNCTNPKCSALINDLLFENRNLFIEIGHLKDEKIRWLEQQKGAEFPGKKSVGDVEKPRTGT